MLALYRRGRVWWARGTVRHQRVRRSLDTSSRETASRRKNLLETELWSGEKAREVDWEAFSEEVLAAIGPSLRLSTLKKYRFVVARFTRFLETEHIETLGLIQPVTVALYIEARAKDKHPTRNRRIKHEGIKSDLRVLHRIFSYAVRCEYISKNPVTQRRNPQPTWQTQPFSQAEIDRMLAACGPSGYPLKPVILTFLHTGLRISDVRDLQKRAVNLHQKRIIVKTAKRGKIVALPLHPNLSDALASLLAPDGCPLVFHTKNGKPLTSLDAYLARLWRRAGIEGAHAHRFRDTFAVRLLEQGASLYDVAHLLGISPTVCAKHYSPYVKELQERGSRLVSNLDFL